MLYILDTDHLSLFQRRHPRVVAKIQATPLPQRAITIITVEEQLRGRLSQIRNARNAVSHIRACAALNDAIRLFASIRILDYDEEANARYEILRQTKIRIGSQDLRIAAIVLATGSILVTRNRSDFEKVPGLIIEDWSAA
jgi:tRNA(fMet)-specific endonuclease VapC